MKAWEEWAKRNAAAIVATDVMVGKTRRVTKSGIAAAQNQIAGFLIVEGADITAAAGLSPRFPQRVIRAVCAHAGQRPLGPNLEAKWCTSVNGASCQEPT